MTSLTYIKIKDLSRNFRSSHMDIDIISCSIRNFFILRYHFFYVDFEITNYLASLVTLLVFTSTLEHTPILTLNLIHCNPIMQSLRILLHVWNSSKSLPFRNLKALPMTCTIRTLWMGLSIRKSIRAFIDIQHEINHKATNSFLRITKLGPIGSIYILFSTNFILDSK